jgi:hypothetical protein
MRIILYFLTFLLLLTISSCDEQLLIPEQPVIDDYGIVMILYKGRNRQKGVITEIVNPKTDLFSDTTHFYPNATLQINGTKFTSIPTDSLFSYKYINQRFTYNYYADSFAVHSANAYNIDIEFDNNRHINGETIVPQGIVFDTIKSSDNYYFVEWDGPDSLSYYWVLWMNYGSDANPDWQEYYSYFSGHSKVARIDKSDITANKRYYMYVYTYDLNYTDYLLNEKQRSGISSGYGVFGSAAIDGFWVDF